MKQAILISTGLLLTTPFIHAEKNKDKKPNVVFILADDVVLVLLDVQLKLSAKVLLIMKSTQMYV